MLRIAILAHSHHSIDTPYAGGLEMHTHLLSKSLANLGHDITLFAKDGSLLDGYEVEALVSSDFAFHPEPAYSFQWSQQERTVRDAYERALNKIQAGSFDAVINNSLNVAPLDWEGRAPMLTVLHTPVLPLLRAPARRAAADPFRLFVAVSNANAQLWSDVVPNAHVVHNGIDIHQWSSVVTPTDELRWCARVTPEKGLHEAIAAARLTGRALSIAGPLSNVDYFNAEIRPLLGGDIQYVGHLDHHELADFYASGAVTLATPLWDEPFGLVVAESLASGTPVAGFPRGAMSELLTIDVGVISTASTPKALAEAIEIAAGKSRQECRRVALKRFDGAVMVDNYLALFRPLLGYEDGSTELCAG